MQDLQLGQEMYLFFGRSGSLGIITLLLSCAIFGIIIYKTVAFVQKENICSYQEFLSRAFKRKTGILVTTVHLIVTLFLGISFIVMCAGVGAYFTQEFGIPSRLGIIAMCALCLLTFKNETSGMVKLNEIAMPMLITFILLLSIFIRGKPNYSVETGPVKSFINAVIYASYNSIVLIPILMDLKKFMKTKKYIKMVSLISIIILLFQLNLLFC